MNMLKTRFGESARVTVTCPKDKKTVVIEDGVNLGETFRSETNIFCYVRIAAGPERGEIKLVCESDMHPKAK
ncbi:MAG: hypothetical protein WAO98_02395 [Alphaproteobacteria bacterium]